MARSGWLLRFENTLKQHLSSKMSGRRTRSRRSYPLNHAPQPAEVLEQRSLLSASAVFVEATGELSVELGSSESAQVSSVNGNVLIGLSTNGSPYVPFTGIGTLSAASIVTLSVFGGDDANTIDLSNVTLATYPNLTTLQAFGDDGHDVLIGSPDLANQLFGGDGNDSLTGGLADDTLNGGDGADTIIANAGNDSIAAGDGTDSVVAGDGNDTISGGNGNDTVSAGNGDDSVIGQNGQDSLLGDAGNDTLNGDGGFDTLAGGDGNDLLLGGDLNDSLVGGDGNDTLTGNSGDDTLVGVTGFDIADGGAGNDLIQSALVTPIDDAVPAAARPAPLILSPAPLPDAVDSTLGTDTSAVTTTIGSGTGDGSLTVQVTSTGAFGIGSFPTTMNAGAPYDPIGGIAAGDTTFDSEIYFRANTMTGARTAIDSLATNRTTIRGTSSEANSSFDIGPLHFVLTQVAEPVYDLVSTTTRVGSLLTQTYRITNTGVAALDFELARYLDGRLRFNGSTTDGGGRFVSTAGDEFLVETDAGGLSATTNFVGITAKGGTVPTTNRFQIEQATALQANLLAGLDLTGQVFNDTTGDQSTDSNFDVSLGLRNTFQLAPNGSVTYTTHTLFGTGTPNQVQLNQKPVAVADTGSDLEGRGVAIDVVSNDFDVDGSLDYQSIQIAQPPINGIATPLGDGRINYTPNIGFFGTDTFAYTIADNLGARSAPAVVTVTVNALDVIGDLLNGGIGNDTILGGDGNDTVLGGGGQDSVNGGAGDDRVQGQGGNDTITGGGGFDKLDGGDGNDVLRSTTGSLVINDVTVVEGDTGTVAAVFTVTLTVPSDSIVTVDFATSGGTATSGIDFVPTSGTLTFLPGVTSQSITVQTIGDMVAEPDETFLVNLTNATNATLSDARGQGTIGDTDGTSFNTPIVNTAGQGFQPLAPPDTDGEVGLNHYVQTINGANGAQVQIYDKNGVVLRTFAMNTLGRGNAPAGATTDGDAMAVYDQLADRWVLMEFSVGMGATPVFGLWVHVSQTPDPTAGLWNTYFFQTAGFPDYPKISVWPDAYYISTNDIAGGAVPAVYALDRTNMLTGAAARPFQRFAGTNLPTGGIQHFSPADLEGTVAPPTGSTAYFMRHNDDEVTTPAGANAAADSLQLWQFRVDFATPANSGFSQLATISVSEFDSNIARSPAFQGRGSIAQPGTATRLHAITEIIMSRTHYRNFGTYEVLVGTFTTETPGNMQHTGVRWFELRRVAGGAWTLFQEGLVNPDNVTSRFMPSIDINGAGDIAIGYSVSDGVSTFPGIRYIGRRANDPLGTMPQGEFTIINGTGSQTAPDRYGDYASMTVDPADDRTFWFTSEYIQAGGNWATQIASMAFSASSGIGGGSTPTPTVADAGDSIVGGAGNDTVLGANGNDTINGNAGNDVLGGGGGNDLILGGADADTLSGGDGDDTLDGQGGNDSLLGDAGDDIFVLGNGSGGDDVVEGGEGFNQIQVNGTGSADNITIGANNRRITVSRGQATITADNNMSVQRLVVNAGFGDDTVTVNDLATIDCAILIIVNGDEGNDRLTAQGSRLGLARLMMNGNAGNDTLIGSLDGDSLSGNDGNDAINGMAGNDSILGGAGDDILAGGLGDDTLDGGDGADFVTGNAGNDRMRGGADNDTLRGFEGDDTLDGQAGDDILNGMDGNDVIRGGVGKDQLSGGAGNDSLDGGRNDDSINGNSGNDSIVGDHGNDFISAGDGNNTVYGGDGNDTVLAEGGDDIVVAGDGDDVVNTDGGNDVILGGDGNDNIQAGAGNDTILGGDGDDTLNGQGGTDVVAGQQGIDVIADPFSEIDEAFSLTSLSSTLLKILGGPAPFPT